MTALVAAQLARGRGAVRGANLPTVAWDFRQRTLNDSVRGLAMPFSRAAGNLQTLHGIYTADGVKALRGATANANEPSWLIDPATGDCKGIVGSSGTTTNNRIVYSGASGLSGSGASVKSSDVPRLYPTADVFAHACAGGADVLVGGVPAQPLNVSSNFGVSVWVWIPSSLNTTALYCSIEGAGITAATAATPASLSADLTKRDQWQRIWAIRNTDASATSGDVTLRMTGGAGVVYSTAPQVAQGVGLVPDMVNAGTTPTRAGDSNLMTDISPFGWNAAGGTIVARGGPLNRFGTNTPMLAGFFSSAGSSADHIQLWYQASVNQFRGQVMTGGVIQGGACTRGNSKDYDSICLFTWSTSEVRLYELNASGSNGYTGTFTLPTVDRFRSFTNVGGAGQLPIVLGGLHYYPRFISTEAEARALMDLLA